MLPIFVQAAKMSVAHQEGEALKKNELGSSTHWHALQQYIDASLNSMRRPAEDMFLAFRAVIYASGLSVSTFGNVIVHSFGSSGNMVLALTAVSAGS